MVVSDTAQHPRLIAGVRASAELLDNCADGLVASELAATVLLLVVVALQMVADLLENCPDALSHFSARRERT